MKRTLKCLFLKSAVFLTLLCALSAIFTSCPGTAGGGGGKPEPTPLAGITVKGDANAIVQISKFMVTKGEKWATVKTNAAITGVTFKDGFELSEWKLNNASGAILNDNYVFNAPMTTVFAVSKSKGTDKVTITVDGDENIKSGKGVSFEVNKGTKWETVKTNAAITGVTFKDGFELSEWKLNDETGIELEDDYAFNANTTVFAVSASNSIFITDEQGVITGYTCDKEKLPETLVIPAQIDSKKVTGIDRQVFEECERIKILDMENCTVLTVIGERAFAGCTNLTEIKFPASITEIKGDTSYAGAFSGCTSLNALDFSKCTKLTKIAGFGKCSGITAITFPASLTEIRKEAFSECKGLTGLLDFSNTALTKIDGWAFRDCIKISSIKFPASLVEITGGFNSSFDGCKGLTGVLDLSNCVKFTKIAGFSSTGITGIELPNTVTEISKNAFSNCLALTGTLNLSKYPSLTKIAGFNSCANITEVKLPASVVEIHGNAFWFCQKLTGEIDMSSCTALTTIDENTFANTAITSIKFPTSASLKKIHKAFSNCSKLTGTLDFSQCTGLTEIGEMAFSNCPKVTAITLPAGITKIEKKAFSKCGITDLNLSSYNRLASIGVESFSDCKALTSVILPASVTEIKSDGYAGSFYGCTEAEITLKEGVTTIGKYAFGEKDSDFVKSVKVPNENIKTLVKNSGYPESKITVGS